MTDDQEFKGFFGSLWQNITKGAQNALEIARVGRLAPEQHAPYTVARRERMYKLRHYARSDSAPAVDAPLLLVPPLMVTAEIYDIDPTSSAVTMLTQQGVDVWVIDFGAPENEEGGFDRTLDDHVRACSQAIDQVRTLTGSDVHLAGYSQGGMFCYQTAAYRRSDGLRSLITFGSPVDIHRNLIVQNELATRLIDSMSGVTRLFLDAIEALPGQFSSIGFRVLSARKEAKQLVDFVANLHDRDALVRGESSRRFLHGEGFVAWPAPALRSFYEQFVVENRMSQGGFVVDGRTLTLADITCPILYFVGERDEFARAPSVHGIRAAAPNTRCYQVTLRTGHFGLVVGTIALKHTWPTLIEWMRFQEQKGLKPALALETPELEAEKVEEPRLEKNLEDVEYNARLLIDTAKDTAQFMRRTLDGVSHTFTSMFDNLRYQVPRLARLERLDAESLVSVGLELTRQAEKNPQGTFFLWQGRAHTYGDADRRVNYVVRGLISCDVKPGMRVGILMHARPAYLSLVAALSRLGAVAVLISPDPERIALSEACALGGVEVLITDPENAAPGRAGFTGPVLVLGGGAGARALGPDVIDMERIDPESVVLPEWYRPNPGRARDLAMVIFTVGKDDRPRAARISNHRWAVAAYGAAAASTLTTKDTIYCCMPLDHAAGLLVSVGGALAGGARLALSEGFDPARFWTEARRYGVTVVYYAGEMCRALVDAPSTPTDKVHSVRLFAGSGMRSDVWERMIERFDTAVLEFYATTEGKAVLANVSGHKRGAVGRSLPGAAEIALVAYDFERDALITSTDGRLLRCFADQPGMLIVRLDAETSPIAEPAAEQPVQPTPGRLVRGAFDHGDSWFVTGDVLRCDIDGDYWFVDRAGDMVRTAAGPVSPTHVEDVLYALPAIEHTSVVRMPVPGSPHDMPVAFVVLRAGYQLDMVELVRHVEQRLELYGRPRFICFVDQIPSSVGFRPMRTALRERGLPATASEGLAYDADLHAYEPVSESAKAETLAQAARVPASAEVHEEPKIIAETATETATPTETVAPTETATATETPTETATETAAPTETATEAPLLPAAVRKTAPKRAHANGASKAKKARKR